MKYVIAIFLSVISMMTAVFAAEKPLYTFYTGTAKGTFYIFGNDIANACPQFNIQVVKTIGTLENISSIVKPNSKSGYRFSIVQSDILDYTLSTNENNGKDLYKLAWPFYNAEIGVVVNRASNIKTVKDLEGKKVSGGAVGSGSWHTTSVIQKALGIKWYNNYLNQADAITALLNGEIDAVIIIGGSPMAYLKELDKSVNSKILLLPITAAEMDSYTNSLVPANTYPWQDYPVQTKAIRAFMIAATDVPDSAINDLKACVINQLPQLKKVGHPKWQEITAQQILNRR